MNYRETEDGSLESRCCGNCKNYTIKDMIGFHRTIPYTACKKQNNTVNYKKGTCDEFERDRCPICQRVVPDEYWEKHHLIPKSKGGKDTVHVCVNCGDMIHKLIPLNLLKKQYNTVEKILTHPFVKDWIEWVIKKPNDFRICMQRKKKR